MSDLSIFRVVRNVQSRQPQPTSVFRPLTDAQVDTKLVRELRGVQQQGGDLRKVAERWIGRGAPRAEEGDEATNAVLRALEDFDHWLLSVEDRPPLPELRRRLDALITDAAWVSAKQVLSDWLLAAIMVARPGSSEVADLHIETTALAGRLTRRLLVAGLRESWPEPGAPEAADAPDRVVDLLSDRMLVLPEALQGFLQTGPETAIRRSALARRPGFADLYVVRSEWSCYVAGELAHVENVMKGEKKERVHVRLDETETTQTTETATHSVEERDTQTTDRFELESETSRETSLQLAIDASVDTSGQYGPTRVNTHVGGSFDYSIEESRRFATARAQELVTRAVSKVEQETRRTRTTRTLNRITETNTHGLDGTGQDAHIVGIYRWVDKIERVQLFRYPHRYLLEFQIPEPAAYLVWAREKSAGPGGRQPPMPFTIDGLPGGRALAVTDITSESYAGFASRYAAADIPPPPAAKTTVAAALVLEAEPPDYERVGDGNINLRSAAPISKTVEIALPDGYTATDASVAASAAPALARWGDWESRAPDIHVNDSNYQWRWGYHYSRVDVVIGDKAIILEEVERPSVEVEPVPFRKGWLTAERPGVPIAPASGRLTVGATAAGSFRTAVSIAITCHATDQLLGNWAADAYARIHGAYLEQRKAYDDAAASVFAPAAGALAGEDPPELNRRLVREELKRAIVTLLLGEPFDGFDTLTREAEGEPRFDVRAVAWATPYVQFLEQAFEWENLTYFCYPYFWGARREWLDTAARRSADPEFAAFLRAGSARVVLPARPGFERSVNAFLAYGVLWGGGPAPTPDHPLYVSIADEIRTMQRGVPGGEPCESWEVRLPTTLVWIDNDSTMPKTNPHTRLTRPADALCPAPRG